MEVLADIGEIRQRVLALRESGRRVGLVPTMGALHAGHLSLVQASRSECDVTVATIFVNPTQFGPHEDLGQYPRTLQADLAALEQQRTDLVFVPVTDAVYPPGFSTFVEPADVARSLEGTCRPGHFRGVATVVLKLFHMIPVQVAYFGQKDYQQSLVIRQMVSDFNMAVEIRVCPIVREPDGLALSSRNRYLSPDERRQALALSRGLQLAQRKYRDGETSPLVLRSVMEDELRGAGISRIEYVAAVDARNLAEVRQVGPETVLLVAARVGSTRLIDNLMLVG